MKGYIDIHHHLVWGIDDGPPDFDTSLRMLYAARANCISRVIATSHFTPGHGAFDVSEYDRRISLLNDASLEHGWGLRIFSGSEIFYTHQTVAYLEEGLVPTLANSRFILTEFSENVEYEYINNAMHSLTNAGYIPVIAHAERYSCLAQSHVRTAQLKEAFNLRIQVNCSSVLHGKTMRQRHYIRKLLDAHLIDYVASDAHNLKTRPVCMRNCFNELRDRYGLQTAMRLTRENQMEIFAS